MSQDVMICVMNSTTVYDDVNLEMKKSKSYKKCLDLDAELLNKQNAYNDLSKSYLQLEKLYIFLESTMKLNQQIFQKDTSSDHQSALEILEYFEYNDLKAQLQAKDTTICQIQEKVFVTTALQNELRKLKGKNVLDNATIITNATTIAPGMFKLDLDSLAPRLLKNRDDHIDYLKYTHEQELLVCVRDTCPTANKPSIKLVAVTPMNKVKKVRFSKPFTSSSNIHNQVESSKTPDSNTPVLPSTGFKSSTSASRSQPTGNKKNNRISQTPSSNMKNKVVQIILWYLDSGCSKHMTGNRFQLMNFVSKFLGTVRFGNDHIAKIIGYGDYQLGNITISRVYYVEGLGHILFFVGQSSDSDLGVAFRKNTCFIWNLDSVDLLSGSIDINLYTISLDDMLMTSSICLLSKALKTKSWLWHRRLSYLNFGQSNQYSLLYPKLFPNLSLIQQNSYELMHNKKPDLSFLHAFGSLRYPTNNSEDLGKLNAKADIVAATPRAVDLPDSPVTTSIYQEVLSISIPSTQKQEQKQSSIINQGVEESPKTPHFNDDPLHETLHEDTTSQGSSSNLWPSHTSFELLEAIRIFIANAPTKNMTIYQMDVKTDFMNEFSKGAVDSTLFTRKAGSDIFLVQIYVDDIIFASTNTAMRDEFAKIMTSKFKMSMMGQMNFFLGLQFFQSPRGVFINQSNYALELIKKYGMLSSDPVNTPIVDKSKLDKDIQRKPFDPTYYRVMIVSLMYLTSIRSDLVFEVCMCARYQTKTTEKHLYTVKQIFRYLKGTIDMGLWYLKDSCITLTAYANADHMRSQQTDYGLKINKIPLYCDSKSAIALCCNNVQHSRSKHIDVRYHFIKEQVENGVVELYFVETEYQLADIFTKAFPRGRGRVMIATLSSS
ncbi:retrovirus-related pol polyprotein from transposon TNT 1-94 [Tanacetum coccineum]